MSVSSAVSGTPAAASQALLQQSKNSFKTMTSDVQSGNLSGAQAALTALQQAVGIQGAQGTGAQQPNQLQTVFANLINSIQGGSLGLGAAQTALGALQQAQPAQTVGGATATSSAQSSFSQDLTALIQSVQSGNLTSAQQDLSQLQSAVQGPGSEHHHHHHHDAAGSSSTANATAGTSGSSSTGSTSASASAYAAMMNLQSSSSSMTAQA